ncbi:uncharacterized protein LOC135496027 [Lineus longissimus]|uniref:uncharacterized protein LOC135496027 n=1 Tax=Lineus longissimus TaxID=88925 RepID=UPI00315DF3DA
MGTHLELIWDVLNTKDREELRDEEDFGIEDVINIFTTMDQNHEKSCAQSFDKQLKILGYLRKSLQFLDDIPEENSLQGLNIEGHIDCFIGLADIVNSEESCDIDKTVLESKQTRKQIIMLSLNWLPTENEKEKDPFMTSLGLMGNFIIMNEERDDGCAKADSGAAAEKNEKIDGVRKHSFTEKLTGVKNARAEHRLQQINGTLSREQARQLRLIHDNKSVLRHEFKLMQHDKKKNTLETKKRSNPHYDFSLEEAGVAKSEQYLKEPVEGWYLQKQNAIRRRSVGDATQVTPLVAKARETLKQSEMMKQLEQYRTEQGLFTATPDPGSSENIQNVGKRPRSKSVSLDSLSLVSSANSTGRHQDKVFRKESPNILPWTPRNPTIDIIVTDLETNEGQKVVASGKPVVKVSGTKFHGYIKDEKTTLHSILHREQMVENESPRGSSRLTNSAKSVSKVTSQRTMNGEIPTPRISNGKPHVSFKVKENNPNGGLHNNLRRQSIGQARPHSDLQARRQSTGGMPSTRRPVTHEMLVRESTDIKIRMNKFFRNLENTKRGVSNDEDDDESDVFPIIPQLIKHQGHMSQRYLTPTPELQKTSQSFNKSTSVDMSAFGSISDGDSIPVPKEEGMYAIILNEKNYDANPGPQRKMSAASKWTFMLNKVTENSAQRDQTPPTPDNNRRSSIISLTGSEISNCSGGGGRRRSSIGIPTHSMERSNRHSATFKLRKLVGELMKQKTRYELNEVEEVKRKLSEDSQDQISRSRTESMTTEGTAEHVD